jgi:hypothetical protein
VSEDGFETRILRIGDRLRAVPGLTPEQKEQINQIIRELLVEIRVAQDYSNCVSVRITGNIIPTRN